jgi:hypothetical protein
VSAINIIAQEALSFHSKIRGRGLNGERREYSILGHHHGVYTNMSRKRYIWRRKEQERGIRMNIWIFILVIVAWFLLQVYILPKFGIST